MGEIRPETKRAILEQEIQIWKNTRYQWEVRLRVLRRVGVTAEELAAAMAQLERCERALDALGEEMAGLGEG